MSQSLDVLRQLAAALDAERAEQSLRFSHVLTSSPVRQRVADGVAWYPVKIRETGYGFGEFPFVVVERVGNPTPHQLSGGKPCNVFSLQGAQQQTADGVIHWVNGSMAHIVLRGNDHPEWLSDGRIGVQVTFDASGFRDMRLALDAAANDDASRLANLRDVLYGTTQPTFNALSSVDAPHLNSSQRHAVQLCLAANDVAVIHGPPGTGKTTTLVEVIRHLAQRRRPVLVCAPSNAAVDLLVERCAAANLDVVRLGNLARVDAAVLEHTLDERWKQHPMAGTVKELRQRANEFRRMAHQYKRSFGRDEATQRKLLFAEARSIIDDVRSMEDQCTELIIDNADVVACTPVTARNRELAGREFSAVVIDEAGQALDPSLWIPIARANSVILAGDPYQLPPTVVSAEASRLGLASTMLERVITTHPSAIALLTEQYRMNTVIMSFSNQEFYADGITAHAEVEAHVFPRDLPLKESFSIVDTSGKGWDESPGDNAESLQNQGEAELCVQLTRSLATAAETAATSLGVISPYRGQVRLLRDLLGDSSALGFASVDVNTVDSFQGSECDVIIISLVRSNADGEIGFLSDTRRMNVAMTRARKRLIIVGDGATVCSHPFYQRLFEYVQEHATLVSAWTLDGQL